MFGSKKQEPPTQPLAQSSAAQPQALQENQSIIFDVTAEDFEDTVMRASMDMPIIVDFWAPWCGPCKQIMPILENVITEAGGEVRLAKVNLDENPELAQALRVQSVPTVFAFIGGQPVDAFQGVIPEGQVKAFIDKQIQASRAAKPGAIDIPEALNAATQALAANDLQTANALYVQILQQDEKNAKAYIGLVRVFIAAEQLEQAISLVENAPEDIAADPAFKEAKTALELAQSRPDNSALAALEKAASDNPGDHQAQIDLAEGQFASGQKEEAIDTLIASIRTDREWNEAAARVTLLKFFEAMGHSDPLSVQGRKKLSSILFS